MPAVQLRLDDDVGGIERIQARSLIRCRELYGHRFLLFSFPVRVGHFAGLRVDFFSGFGPSLARGWLTLDADRQKSRPANDGH